MTPVPSLATVSDASETFSPTGGTANVTESGVTLSFIGLPLKAS